jgi:hypothetical protein
MNAKEAIDYIVEHEGISRYRLAKWLGAHESLLSRAYNGMSDPGFNEVNTWLDKLGFVLEIREADTLDDSGSFAIDRFGWMLDATDRKNYDYLSIHRSLKQLLEAKPSAQTISDISFRPEQMGDRYWRAFYSATIAYLSEHAGARTPQFANANDNCAPKPWSPIQRARRSQTDFDERYADYNIKLPKGELEWI